MGHPFLRSGKKSCSVCLFTPAGCAAHHRLPSKVHSSSSKVHSFSSKVHTSSSFSRQGLVRSTTWHSLAQLGSAWHSSAQLGTARLLDPLYSSLQGPFSSAFLHTVRCCVCSMRCLPTVTPAFPMAVPGTITHSQPEARSTLPLEAHSKSSVGAGWGHTGTGWPSQVTPHPGIGTTFS